MFTAEIYKQRRQQLAHDLNGGLAIFVGNEDVGINYTDNIYPFRQDSSFLYFFGINLPGLMATLDADTGTATLYGHDLTLDDVIWTGPQPSMADWCQLSGCEKNARPNELWTVVSQAQEKRQTIHYLPCYRHAHRHKLADVLGVTTSEMSTKGSRKFIDAVFKQRAYKADFEIKEMHLAANISKEMHIAAMKATKAGKYEYEALAEMIAELARHHGQMAYNPIFTVNGQTLHNHYHSHKMAAGQLLLMDVGAENAALYASDITRTIPVSGRFTSVQKDLYSIVLSMLDAATAAVTPGVSYADINHGALNILMEGLADLGFVKAGAVDLVSEGIAGLFMPHGLGHMIGLDVHDMEALGEDAIGYETSQLRSPHLGLKSLRLARKLEEGYAFTIEPGLYFIPELIDKWASEGKFKEFIHYDKLNQHRDFGGIRIEDNVVLKGSGAVLIGDPIPKTIDEIETLMG